MVHCAHAEYMTPQAYAHMPVSDTPSPRALNIDTGLQSERFNTNVTVPHLARIAPTNGSFSSSGNNAGTIPTVRMLLMYLQWCQKYLT